MPIDNSLMLRLIFLLLVVVSVKSQTDQSCGNSTDWGCADCPTGSGNFTVFNLDTSLYTCANQPNCLQVNTNKQCLRCSTGFTLSNASCYTAIQNCIEYSLDTNTNILQCTECRQKFMNQSTNCQVSIDQCQSFNYRLRVCEVCNRTGQFMDQSRQFCVKYIPNCVIYVFDGCGQCQQQYIVNPINKSQCSISFSVEYQILSMQLNQATQRPITTVTSLCLKNNFYQSASQCIEAQSQFTVAGNTVLSYNCKNFDITNSSCGQCIQGFYLAQTICMDCTITINKCLTCSYNCATSSCKPNCTICQPTHYVFFFQGHYICRQCSTYGCSKCQTDVNKAIVCTECQRGKTLFNNTCFSCPSDFELNLMTLVCAPCPLNCASCSNGVCTWCKQTYVRDLSNLCVLNSTLSGGIAITSSVTIFEILSKHFPNQQTLIYNNQVDLMSSCKGQATRFSCLCSSNSSSTVSSMCYSLAQASKFNITKVFTPPITTQTFFIHSQTLRLMAQLPSFDSLTFSMDFSATTNIYFTESKIASLLQIYAQMLRRKTTTPVSQSLNGRLLNVDTTQILSQLFNIAEHSFRYSLSRQKATVIYGNGYYMKYYPIAIQISETDGSFVKVHNRNVTQPLFVFVWFDNLDSSKSLTGTIYAYTSLPQYDLTVEIQQLNFPSTTFSYQLQEKGLKSSISVQKTNTNSLSFNIKTSTVLLHNDYNVQYVQTAAVDVDNLFSSQRIQFIFYQSAFIYVLVFLVAYLFLIPCCALLDFISPKRAQHRKRVRSEDLSFNQEGKPVTSEEGSASQQTIQISVNYRDFFPIYNICNTPRPKRILKLCLFLLNMQHGITFLTLIYYGLGAGHPVVGVVIGIPAYLCTIIMGYICGVMTIVIPGWFKYMINLLVLGYWIIWVAFMPRFSPEYQPFVIIFVGVFFVLDLIIDCLEMFMVYFSIINSEKKTKMFECLAAWLSKRGYYEYDQLAHQMNDEDQ